MSGRAWRRSLVLPRTKRGVEGPRLRVGTESLLLSSRNSDPSTVQVSPGPHLPWTHLPACWEGLGFSGQARLLLGTQLPMLRMRQTSPGPCGRYFYPPSEAWSGWAQWEQQRDKDSHGSSSKGLSWAEALPLRGPHFCCWFLETMSPNIGQTSRACACVSRICFWALLLTASAALCCCLAGLDLRLPAMHTTGLSP